MNMPPLSVTIITLNEEKNLARTLESVQWASDIVVVDCGSQDRTAEIAQSLGARVVQNAWKGYGQQKNFAQKQALHDWVLNIDADEVVTPELKAEIHSRLAGADSRGIQGFWLPRKTYYLGRWILHGGWYPNYLCRLVDRRHAQWTEPEVHEELLVQGKTEHLGQPLLHYSFTGIQDQIRVNLKYSWFGFQKLLKKGHRASICLLLIKPVGKFIETYILKKGFLDGIPGFIISINAAHSIFLKYAYLFEAKIDQKKAK